MYSYILFQAYQIMRKSLKMKGITVPPQVGGALHDYDYLPKYQTFFSVMERDQSEFDTNDRSQKYTCLSGIVLPTEF